MKHFSLSLAFGVSWASAAALYRTVDAPLDEAAVIQLSSCVQGTNDTYKFMVDDTDGAIVVYPETPREVDYATVDSQLYGCMSTASDRLKVVLESSFEDNKRDGFEWSELSFALLGAHDAKGQGLQLIDQLHPNVTFKKRDPEDYYYFYEDVDGDDCESSDILDRELSTCYTYGNPFKSVQCENDDTSVKLSCTIYPHHDCKAQKSKKTGKLDSRTFVVAPRTLSACQVKTTYSYFAAYVKS